jgi:hypothetical protein
MEPAQTGARVTLFATVSGVETTYLAFVGWDKANEADLALRRQRDQRIGIMDALTINDQEKVTSSKTLAEISRR